MMVIFEKGVCLRHIGHLDVMRTMQRALRRSTLPIVYSKGFHPHVQLSFASPLSVGVVGLREVMDVPLDVPVEEERFVDMLNQVLPACLQVRSARVLEDDFPALMALVAASQYILNLEPGEVSQTVIDQVSHFMTSTTYNTLRKTKKGEAMCNIRPFVLAAEVEGKENGWAIHCTIEATAKGTLKPALWMKCLCEMAGIEGAAFLAVREAILCRRKDGTLSPMEEYRYAQ